MLEVERLSPDEIKTIIRTYLNSSKYHSSLTGQAFDISSTERRELFLRWYTNLFELAFEY